jgi:hypothetical protein
VKPPERKKSLEDELHGLGLGLLILTATLVSIAVRALHPVSQIDMALSEGVTRQLVLAMSSVPKTEADAAKLEDANSKEEERKAARASVDEHRKFLLKLVVSLPQVAPITGKTERDLRVVNELATLNWSTVLDTRDPSGFAD